MPSVHQRPKLARQLDRQIQVQDELLLGHMRQKQANRFVLNRLLHPISFESQTLNTQTSTIQTDTQTPNHLP